MKHVCKGDEGGEQEIGKADAPPVLPPFDADGLSYSGNKNLTRKALNSAQPKIRRHPAKSTFRYF